MEMRYVSKWGSIIFITAHPDMMADVIKNDIKHREQYPNSKSSVTYTAETNDPVAFLALCEGQPPTGKALFDAFIGPSADAGK